MIIAIDTFDDSRLDPYVRLTDLALRHRLEPEKGLFIAEGETVITEALRLGYEPISLLTEPKWLPRIEAMAERFPVLDDVPLFVAPHALIAEYAGYEVTRGALGAFRRKPPLAPEALVATARSIVVLVGISNVMNVGAILRNAAALGADGALIDATSADPLYRRALRASMGCALSLPYARWPELNASSDASLVRWLQDRGFETIALALADDAVDITDVALPPDRRRAILLGSEGFGLPDDVIRESAMRVRIPMARAVDSLNVAAASAIALWTLVPRF